MTQVIEEPKVSQQQEELVNALLADGWSQEDAEQTIAEFLAEAADDAKAIDQVEITKSYANWIIGKLARANRECADIDAMAAEEKARIDKRAAGLKKSWQNKVAFLTARYSQPLEQWAATELEGEKKRSVGLLAGSVGFRKRPDAVVLDMPDEEAIAYLEAQNFSDCVRVKKEVSKTNLKTALTGEGKQYISKVAHIEPGEDEFYIKTEV